jgi:hypothetical protein
MSTRHGAGKYLRQITALAVASTFLNQNFAWALCSDGTKFPAGGYVIGQAPVQDANNFSPFTFTGAAGSLFIPDNSTCEHNDCAKEPLTGGGHNWVFDQGSTLCKVTDTGPPGRVATAWSIPANNGTDCVILPVIRAGRFTNLGDLPYQGDAVTPTCDPSLLAPNPANTYFNQLGCSISHGVATTAQDATTFLFVAGLKGGLFNIPLENLGPVVVGGNAGKGVSGLNYYSDIPEGRKLTNAAISKDGQVVIATSSRRLQPIFACLNPLGDPGDPSHPINPNFFVPPASKVNCMVIGNNGLVVDLTTAFGPDNQPYFGGQRVVQTFNSRPGSSARNPAPTAWPRCIAPAGLTIAQAFAGHNSGHCGSAQPNGAFTAALITQPQAIISHGNYIYAGPLGGTLVQFKVSVDPISGFSEYAFRTYVTGLSIVTGLGVAEDLESLIVMGDPTALGLAAQERMTKLPLCEDMNEPSGSAFTGGGAIGGILGGGAPAKPAHVVTGLPVTPRVVPVVPAPGGRGGGGGGGGGGGPPVR